MGGAAAGDNAWVLAGREGRDLAVLPGFWGCGKEAAVGRCVLRFEQRPCLAVTFSCVSVWNGFRFAVVIENARLANRDVIPLGFDRQFLTPTRRHHPDHYHHRLSTPHHRLFVAPPSSAVHHPLVVCAPPQRFATLALPHLRTPISATGTGASPLLSPLATTWWMHHCLVANIFCFQSLACSPTFLIAAIFPGVMPGRLGPNTTHNFRPLQHKNNIIIKSCCNGPGQPGSLRSVNRKPVLAGKWRFIAIWNKPIGGGRVRASGRQVSVGQAMVSIPRVGGRSDGRIDGRSDPWRAVESGGGWVGTRLVRRCRACKRPG